MWKPQWEKANVALCEAGVTELLAGITLPTEVFYCDGVNCQSHDLLIEKYYCDIVNCLKTVENICVPSIKVGVQKLW